MDMNFIASSYPDIWMWFAAGQFQNLQMVFKVETSEVNDKMQFLLPTAETTL